MRGGWPVVKYRKASETSALKMVGALTSVAASALAIGNVTVLTGEATKCSPSVVVVVVLMVSDMDEAAVEIGMAAATTDTGPRAASLVVLVVVLVVILVVVSVVAVVLEVVVIAVADGRVMPRAFSILEGRDLRGASQRVEGGVSDSGLGDLQSHLRKRHAPERNVRGGDRTGWVGRALQQECLP